MDIDRPDFVAAPLLTVPGLTDTSLDRVPNQVPRLRPDPRLVDKWRTKLSGYRKFKMAIKWRSNGGAMNSSL